MTFRAARDPAVVAVATPTGPGRLFVDAAAEPAATLVLGHGAGGGVAAPDLELLARRLPGAGITVVRFEQPWRTAGGRVAVRPPQLDLGWRAAVEALLGTASGVVGAVAGAVFFGGRSAGARVACRTAPDYHVAGVVCLAFPLHLPGRPDRSRVAELLTPHVPRLVLQGSRDTFGTTAEVRAAVASTAGVEIVDLPGADHSYRLAPGSPLTPAGLRDLLAARVLAFLGQNAGEYRP